MNPSCQQLFSSYSHVHCLPVGPRLSALVIAIDMKLEVLEMSIVFVFQKKGCFDWVLGRFKSMLVKYQQNRLILSLTVHGQNMSMWEHMVIYFWTDALFKWRSGGRKYEEHLCIKLGGNRVCFHFITLFHIVYEVYKNLRTFLF